MAPTTADQNPAGRGRKVLECACRPFRHGGGQGCQGIRRRESCDIRRRRRPIQGFRRSKPEERIGGVSLEPVVIGLPLQRQCAAFVTRQAEGIAREVVDRGIARAAIEGLAGDFGRGLGWIDPGDVRDAADVQKHQRRQRADPSRQRVVIEGRERRALPARSHIGAAKVPGDGLPQCRRQAFAGPRLMRPPPARVMRQGLAVKPH